jgi:hypothetical protein
LTDPAVSPAGHEKMSGRPETAGEAVSSQVEARATFAEIVVVPPPGGSPAGVATSPVTAGGAALTLAGSRGGLAENVQLVAFETDAVSVTRPPLLGTSVVLSWKLLMTGFKV